MGFFESLFGTGKQHVTPDQMAKVVHEAATDLARGQESSVHELFQSAGVMVTDDPRYQLEVAVYLLFLLDVLVNRAFGQNGVPVRERIRERFADRAIRLAGEPGLARKSESGWVSFLESRFEEYAPALRRSMESEGKMGREALALPELACANILGEDKATLQAQMALAMQWPQIFKHLGRTFREEYELIEKH